MNSTIMKTIARLELIVGIAGSAFIGYTFGASAIYGHDKQDWGLTIGIFAGCLVSVLLVFAVLLAIVSIMGKQEYHDKKLIEITSMLQQKKDNH